MLKHTINSPISLTKSISFLFSLSTKYEANGDNIILGTINDNVSRDKAIDDVVFSYTQTINTNSHSTVPKVEKNWLINIFNQFFIFINTPFHINSYKTAL